MRLFAIDRIGSELAGGVPYTVPLTGEFLASNSSLPVDTTHFETSFKDRLLAALGDIDDTVSGTLVHGENFQALALLEQKFRGCVGLFYIDPPYNTRVNEFPYKDNYQHSSWLSLISDRLDTSLRLLSRGGVFACSLDDSETYRFGVMVEALKPRLTRLGEFVWRTRNTDNRVISRLSVDHEYIHVLAPVGSSIEGRVVDRSNFKNPDNDPRGSYTTDPLTGKANAQDRPNLHYLIVNPHTGDEYAPEPDFGWITDRAGFNALLADDRIYWPKNPKTGSPRKKRFLSEAAERTPVSSLEIEIKQGEGNRDLAALFGEKLLNFPKPVSVMKTVVDACCPSDGTVVDFFAGPGTTGEAVVRLNRESSCRRNFVLVEVGDYFDSLLKPRVLKAIGASDWEDGVPTMMAGSPRVALRYIRLESYEDTLNNLDLRRTPHQQTVLDLSEARGADGLKEQYLLGYMLDVESRGSASLLNVAAFMDPTAYRLRVRRPGSDESREAIVDLLETFNWLLGLTVRRMAAPRTFAARFARDAEGRLRLDGALTASGDGPWWFRTVTGTLPDGRAALVVWRKRPGGEAAEGVEQDNLVLDEWFAGQGFASGESAPDVVYVNGDCNLENLKAPGDRWTVRLIEEDFHRLMFETDGA